MTRAIGLVLVLTASALQGEPAQWLVTLGPIELEVSDRAIEGVTWRGIYIFGDHHSNRRPVAAPRLLTDRWQRLAEPAFADSQVALERRDGGAAAITWTGSMRENDGPGLWRWTQQATLSPDGALTLRYQCKVETPPKRPVRYHRYCFVMNRGEVLAPKGREKITRKTAGKPVTATLADGQAVTRGFGESPNILQRPRTIALPFQGHAIRLGCDTNVRSTEFWNAGWAQMTNLALPAPAPSAQCELTVDLAELLAQAGATARIERIPPRDKPWLVADVPERAKPLRPLRFAQCTPSINNWHGRTKLDSVETERQVTEMVKHFDVVELSLAWADWRYGDGWDSNPAALAAVDALAAKAQEWIDIGHNHKLMLALDLTFGGGEPGTGKHETRRKPEFQAEVFDPAAGEFHKVDTQFDWANADGLVYARQAWRGAAARIHGADFLFFNEPHYRLRPWHRAPFFSEAALADFRRFCRDPQARFPAKAWAKPTDRTEPDAAQTDWRRWEDWIAAVYARRIQVCTEAVREANLDNPLYRGAIWFQNVEWIGPDWGTDLDKICALPEVKYIVCEYCTNADSEHWRKFRYFAHKHGTKLSSFVNICWYDGLSKSRYRFQGDDASFRRAVAMGVGEHADMISLYHCAPTFPWHPAYHPSRTRIWDETTQPYCLPER